MLRVLTWVARIECYIMPTHVKDHNKLWFNELFLEL